MQPPTATLAANTLIQGRYLVVRTIGRGGMGAVYEAEDQRLGHRIALKQMLLSGESVTKAFEREARILAALRHPGLPKVSDSFSEALGQFLVMEYIPGSDLGALLGERGQPFMVDEVLRWAEQILAVLEYLHSQTPPIIHRDIKPQNIKLTPRGEIVLLDFGLAKGYIAERSSTTASLFGYTPQYAPLEQIQGSGTTPASDLYALAATLHHLLTGTPPPDVLQRLGALASNLPDPLHATHELNVLVPAAIGQWLVHGMQVDQARRPPGATAMRAELREIQRSAATGSTLVSAPLPVGAVPPTQSAPLSLPAAPAVTAPIPTVAAAPPAPPPERRRRDPLLFIAAGLLALVVLLGAVLIVVLGRDGQRSELDEAYTQTVLALVATSDARSTAGPPPSPAPVGSPIAPPDTAAPTATPAGPELRFGPLAPQRPAGARASAEAPPGIDSTGGQTSFAAINVIDGQPDTAWRVPGDGVGEFVELSFAQPVRLHAVQIIPGYAKIDPVDGTDRFRQNRRVEWVRLEFSDGSSVEFNRIEASPNFQELRLEQPVLTDFVRVVIVATSAPGADDGRDFTPISEVVVVGEAQQE